MIKYSIKIGLMVFVLFFSLSDKAYSKTLSCQEWIAKNHTLSHSNHGCSKYSSILNSVSSKGKGVIPVGSNRFFIVDFPQNWDQLTNKKIVVTMHGSGGCAEPLYDNWQKFSKNRNYAIVAMQYGADTSSGEKQYDDSPALYQNLVSMYSELKKHCSVENVPVILHGFSKGSARTFELAALDRAGAGQKIFSVFISDSGTIFPEYKGRLSPHLAGLNQTAYNGANFLLYCGMHDHNGRTCQGMQKMEKFVTAHGGTVMGFINNPRGKHGIFNSGTSQNPGRAISGMLNFIDRLK